jgi:hypothetical protein
MTEKPPAWDDVVGFHEMLARFSAVICARIAGLPLDVQDRIATSERRDPRFGPLDATWLALWVELDDGEQVQLGNVARATFRRDPPSLS